MMTIQGAREAPQAPLFLLVGRDSVEPWIKRNFVGSLRAGVASESRPTDKAMPIHLRLA